MAAAQAKGKKDDETVHAQNRRALHDYAFDERFEAGVVLTGSEVKSIRDGKILLGDAYADVRGGELWLLNAQIAVYPFAHERNHDPMRDRKLLVHREELRRLTGKVKERGYTLIPLRIYSKKGRIKVEVGLGRGKREYEKRETLKKREDEREAAAAIRRRR